LPDFSVSPSLSCGPIGDAASRHLANLNGRDLSTLMMMKRLARSYVTIFLDLVFTYSKLYTVYEETPENKKRLPRC
jgi:hypothetical protein